jgi:hypothetical protein
MVDPSEQYRRQTSFALATVALAALAGMTGGLLYFLLAAAGKPETTPEMKRYLVRLASLALGGLVLALVLLAGLAARYIGRRLKTPLDKPAPKPLPYGDAWAEAAKRLDPHDAPPVDGFEDKKK